MAAGPLRRPASRPLEALEWVEVRRVDLDTTLLAGGDLQPAKQAAVTCQVEDLADLDGTMILSMIENGATVKKGDELCRLDSAPLEEMARQQEIAVNQARTWWLQIHLGLETARIALREYQDGLVVQRSKEFEGRIALLRSDFQRQADRLAWTEVMVGKGYASQAQLLTERQALARARHDLRKAEGEFDLFRRFEVPKEVRSLEGEIEKAATNDRVEADRLKAEQDRLAHIRKQIANCTLRAPQDGIVVYTNGYGWWATPLKPGDRAYQDEELFLIPDLSRMEAEVSVHETMAPRVRVGMKADVRIAAMGERVFPGRVVSIDLLPTTDWKGWDERLKRFLVRVRLDQTPPRALRFMSAIVRFDTGRVPDALVIPVEAMAVVDGRQSCYVAGSHGLERRAITTRRATTELLEVTGGLDEGERVVARSQDVRGIPIDPEPTDPATARDAAPTRTASPSRMGSPAQPAARAS
jgi:HlyD family secretion protein